MSLDIPKVLGMNKISVVVDFCVKSDMLIETAAEMALLFKLEVHLVQIVETPESWEYLARSTRLKYPEVMEEVNQSRDLLNTYLTKLRDQGIKASKQIVFLEKDKLVNADRVYDADLVMGCKSYLRKVESRKINCLRGRLKAHRIPLMEVEAGFSISGLSEITLISDYANSNALTERFILMLLNKLKFDLNLSYINTQEEFETSELSINKMKRIINDSGFVRTKMSVFNAVSEHQGILDYEKLKGSDLFILEKPAYLTPKEVLDCETTLLIIP